VYTLTATIAAGQAEAWRAEAAALQADISTAALQLSQARRAAAGSLSSAVQGCLAQLAMGSSRFAVDIAWVPAGQAEQQVGGLRRWRVSRGICLKLCCRYSSALAGM
jgi:DNA repair ATPase RecN